MMKTEKLSKSELKVAEMIAWGASQKEIADNLCKSQRTIENQARSIYAKLHIQKATELSVWWFCTHFGISFQLSPLKRKLGAVVLLLLFLPTVFQHNDTTQRARRSRCRTRTSRTRSRRSEIDIDTWIWE